MRSGCLMLRCGGFMAILAIGLIVFGVEGIHEAQAFKNPQVINYSQFVKTNPPEGWFVVKGCSIDVTDAMYETYVSRDSSNSESSDAEQPAGASGGTSSAAAGAAGKSSQGKSSVPASGKSGANPNKKDSKSPSKKSKVAELPDLSTLPSPSITRVYIPVHSLNDRQGKDQSGLVLATEDPQIISAVNDMLKLDKIKTTDDQIEAWVIKNSDRLFLERDLHGMVQSGIHANDKDREQLARLSGKLTPDYAILDDGRTPTAMGQGIGLIVAGILLGVVTLTAIVAGIAGRGGGLAGGLGRGRADRAAANSYPGSAPPLVVPYAPSAPFRTQAPPQNVPPHAGLDFDITKGDEGKQSGDGQQ